MTNFTNLFIAILFIISMFISCFILQSFQYKKSFIQINQILSSSETIETSKTKILRNLHDYLEDKTDKQIMLDNFQFQCKYIKYFYNISLIIIPLTMYLFLSQGLSENNKLYLIFFTPSVIILMLLGIYFLIFEFIHLSTKMKQMKFSCMHYMLGDFIFCFTNLLFQCLKFHPSKILKKMEKVIEIFIYIFVKSFLLIFATLTIFLLLLCICIFIINLFINKNDTIEISNALVSCISSHKITESTDSIQFSLSALFFTLAISGTVIFSINQVYLAQKQELENKLSTKLEDYIEWYNQNKLALDLNIFDSFDESKRNRFNDVLAELRSKLSDPTVKNLRVSVKNYQNFIYLIIISYCTGIITILIPVDFMSHIFVCFCIASSMFIVLAYQIFCDYKN